MSNEQKAAIVAAVGYKSPTWIIWLVRIAQATKWLGGLSAAGGVLSGFVTSKWGIVIFGAAYGLGKIVELIGDFIDDQKFNNSFAELVAKS